MARWRRGRDPEPERRGGRQRQTTDGEPATGTRHAHDSMKAIGSSITNFAAAPRTTAPSAAADIEKTGRRERWQS
jgi:hypothetical protein